MTESELVRVRAAAAYTRFLILGIRARACVRALRARVFGGVYVYICVFSGARALTEFTLRHHAGTLNKCLNGRIVHYQPGVAG